MRRHHYATDSTGSLHVFHSPASRNGWVYGRAAADPQARAITAYQARAIIGPARFLRLRDSAHDRHTMLQSAQEDEDPNQDWIPVAHILGQPYEGKAGPRQPHNMLTWDCGNLNLVLFISSPSELEIQAFRTLPAKVGLHLEPPVLWLLFDIPAVHVADAPFTPHLVAPEARHFPDLATTESRYPMTVVMADANTGTIQSLRYSTLSPSLSRQLQEATATLLHQPFSNEEYQEAVQRMYHQYPDPGAMLRLPPVIDLLGA